MFEKLKKFGDKVILKYKEDQNRLFRLQGKSNINALIVALRKRHVLRPKGGTL